MARKNAGRPRGRRRSGPMVAGEPARSFARSRMQLDVALVISPGHDDSGARARARSRDARVLGQRNYAKADLTPAGNPEALQSGRHLCRCVRRRVGNHHVLQIEEMFLPAAGVDERRFGAAWVLALRGRRPDRSHDGPGCRLRASTASRWRFSPHLPSRSEWARAFSPWERWRRSALLVASPASSSWQRLASFVPGALDRYRALYMIVFPLRRGHPGRLHGPGRWRAAPGRWRRMSSGPASRSPLSGQLCGDRRDGRCDRRSLVGGAHTSSRDARPA